jgi:hypothetical protein
MTYDMSLKIRRKFRGASDLAVYIKTVEIISFWFLSVKNSHYFTLNWNRILLIFKTLIII